MLALFLKMSSSLNFTLELKIKSNIIQHHSLKKEIQMTLLISFIIFIFYKITWIFTSTCQIFIFFCNVKFVQLNICAYSVSPFMALYLHQFFCHDAENAPYKDTILDEFREQRQNSSSKKHI